jgi:hypothetical protein
MPKTSSSSSSSLFSLFSLNNKMKIKMTSSSSSSSVSKRMISILLLLATMCAAGTIRSASGKVVQVEVEKEKEIQNQNNNNIYGTQCSFAITGPKLDGCTSGNTASSDLTKQRQTFYNEYMNGCYNHYSRDECLDEEITRMEMNQRQPQSMINMTSTGYMKTKAPDSLMKLLTEFWEQNKDEKEIEEWNSGSIYTVRTLFKF